MSEHPPIPPNDPMFTPHGFELYSGDYCLACIIFKNSSAELPADAHKAFQEEFESWGPIIARCAEIGWLREAEQRQQGNGIVDEDSKLSRDELIAEAIANARAWRKWAKCKYVAGVK